MKKEKKYHYVSSGGIKVEKEEGGLIITWAKEENLYLY